MRRAAAASRVAGTGTLVTGKRVQAPVTGKQVQGPVEVRVGMGNWVEAPGVAGEVEVPPVEGAGAEVQGLVVEVQEAPVEGLAVERPGVAGQVLGARAGALDRRLGRHLAPMGTPEGVIRPSRLYRIHQVGIGTGIRNLGYGY